MKLSKKIIAISLTVLALSVLFAACGKKETPAKKVVTEKNTSENVISVEIATDETEPTEDEGTTGLPSSEPNSTKPAATDHGTASKPSSTTVKPTSPAGTTKPTSPPSTNAPTSTKPTPSSTTTTTTSATSTTDSFIGNDDKDDNGFIWFG